VNTSDECLIDEAALADALKHGQVRAAALDAYNTEPFYRSISTYTRLCYNASLLYQYTQ